MSQTELSNLQTLIFQVLPDPRGYAERVVRQLLELTAVAGAVDGDPEPDTISAEEEATTGDNFVLLAGALGACKCLGRNSLCSMCGGEGRPLWLQPDELLYQEFILPVVQYMGAPRQGGEDDSPEGKTK